MDRNIFDFDTENGIKRIEIKYGDILQSEDNIDVLVISAFCGHYKPTSHTMIESLKDIGINVATLAKEPYIDLRNSQHVWLSQQLPSNKPFQRIACIELSPQKGVKIELSTIKQRMHALFAMLAGANYAKIPISKIAMPIIGAHSQDYSPSAMIQLIFQEGSNALQEIPNFMEMHVIDNNLSRFSALDTAFNHLLGRLNSDIDVPKLYDATQEKLNIMRHSLVQIKDNYRKEERSTKQLASFIDSFNTIEQDPRYLIAFKCRRLAELIVKDLLGKKANGDLVKLIDEVCPKYSFPTWIACYWHTIRTLGNEGVHIKDIIQHHQALIYKHPTQDDINILLLCMAQIVNIWKNIRVKPAE